MNQGTHKANLINHGTHAYQAVFDFMYCDDDLANSHMPTSHRYYAYSNENRHISTQNGDKALSTIRALLKF